MGLESKNDISESLHQLKEVYRAALFDDLVPWWETHSVDRKNGGYYTRLAQDGLPYSEDKDMWMTGRQIWMFSHLYNRFEKREEWKDIAKHGMDFMLSNAFGENGKMHFRLNSVGQPISSILSLYTEVFGAIALAEYAALSKNEGLKDRAFKMYDFLLSRLGQPSDTPMLGYPLNREFHLHSHDMCRITVAKVFKDIWPLKRFDEDITLSIESILNRHWKSDEGYLLENVGMDGSKMLDIPEGRLFHPGHAIESAWMIMEIGIERNEKNWINEAVAIILASLEHGWDKEYGGIRYLTNIDWTPTHELEADLKLWWPHGEALYALLLAWLHTGREDIKAWYQKVHQYTFAHFPDREHGEWYGYLNRDGSPVWSTKANGWKGFFHIPRILFRCHELLENTIKSTAEND
ncbi:N-acylglucosamine 2-epimerase [Allomuricauda ruestringensis DSM 13258]|uniref:N-acylglucosamine 2-epimerase n=1 Tax=Allomuricauda ruestringensis (strain DSM 13258 / CIP 107369 / LMG 19739 / B1) TaxID=886377 RepID=G2PN13_ALLRU|nr:AGE family epimerase/isomerase [Allomuricauda ruestringensis]AEM72361.1 N-acylglucosamine 2-epimerase [Allomuricauda ruestringensis DSM 13258]